jgi:DNA mismatch repair ATPase MutS
MQDLSSAKAYQQQLKELNTLLSTQKQMRRRLGWLRFIVFVLTIIVSYQTFIHAGLYGWLAIATGLGILLFLVSFDVDNNAKIKNTETLISVNEEELKILQHHFHHRFDGSRYVPDAHSYSNDLDIFDKASLYQWTNRCFTEQGRDLLANNLLAPLPIQQVKERHKAVKEITPLLQWRQQLQSYAIQTAITNKTERKATEWIKEEEKYFVHPAWKVAVWIYTILTLASLIATILGFLSASTFSTLFFLYFIISITLSRNTIKPYVLLSGIVKEISTLHALVKCIEEQKFNSALLNRLQTEAKGQSSLAAKEIKELKSILDRFDLRLNIAGLLFFNSFLLWDVRQMMALNAWRKRNRDQLSRWFEMIAEVEVLNSLATVHFNQPEWAFPKFSENHFTINGTSIGHPLIPDNTRVDNDFDLKGVAKIGLITGSNMAGKSTFLRSLGVNIVLAQVGSPVCAKAFELSPVQLMSSMRIADNLAENTSTFYAELKKLKTIIEAVNQHEQVFILLDEILRGTNSLDRHTGSAALIRQMIKQKAAAVIATHDVELAKLEREYPSSIENYHFDVQVEGEELYFDYKLKQGICTSLNASILMKKIGIELS